MKSNFMQLPSNLSYGQKIQYEEDKLIEFKAVQYAKKPIEYITKLSMEYLNAFINSQGGSIWFGIEDDSTVKGLFISQRDRDQLRLAIDVNVNSFIPQVDSQSVRVDFIPVLCRKEDVSLKYVSMDICDDFVKSITLENTSVCSAFVIVASILPGLAPVYFTSKSHDMAFIRRDGGITRLSPDVIIQRITQGRKDNTTGAFSFGDIFDFQGRRELVTDCLEFLTQSQQPTKVLVLYGLVSVGKSKLADYLRQIILSDRQRFPEIPKVFQLDLKGTIQKDVNQYDAMLHLIRSMNPSFNPTFIQQNISESEETSIQNTVTDISILFKDHPDESSKTDDKATSLQLRYQQEIKNIYFNLCQQQKYMLLLLENVGDPKISSRLIPVGVNCLVICTCRKVTLMETIVSGPAVKILEINVPPLTDEEGGLLVMSWIPGTNLEEAQSISKLCGGLPQVIKILCANCQRYGLRPQEMILKLRQVDTSKRMKQLSPSLFAILSTLTPLQLRTLAILSVFPSIFSDDAACAMLGQQKIDRIFQQDTDTFQEVINLGLVDRVQPPCIGLRVQVWWRVNDTIREFCYKHLPDEYVQTVIDRFQNYFLDVAEQLKTQYEVYVSNFSQKAGSNQVLADSDPKGLFKKVSPNQLCQYIFELFLTLSPCFEVCLKICQTLLQDSRRNLQSKGMERCQKFLTQLAPFSTQFSSVLGHIYNEISTFVFSKQLVSPTASALPAEPDRHLWAQIFLK